VAGSVSVAEVSRSPLLSASDSWRASIVMAELAGIFISWTNGGAPFFRPHST
jgi:hypothetical protein